MKFFNPFGTGAIWISQTYHAGSKNIAVDMVGALILNPWSKLYAVADGKVKTITGILGGYLALDIDNSNIRALYVHGDRWVVKVGQHVKRGQHIGYIKNFTPKHLHLGLQYKQGSGYPNLMDYMDRSLTYKTKYPSIRAIWWKDGEINWSLFKDKSYLKEVPKYTKGQKLVFLAAMNYRKQNGDKDGNISKNAVCELKGNGVWGTIDGYTGWWYDADFLDKTGGQIADTKLNTTTDKPVSNIDSTVPKLPTPCEEYKKEIERLEQELRASEEALDDTLEELEEVEAENVLLLEDKDFLVRLSTDLKDSQRYAVE